MRHDEPRRATRAARIAAQQAVRDACAAHGLRAGVKSHDRAAVERDAEALRAAFAPINREVYFGECIAILL